MGWNDIPKPKPTPPGEWEKIGTVNFIAWYLRCPPCFAASIHSHGNEFFLEVNREARGPRKSLEAAQIEAETVIASQIKELLPVYKVIVQRLEKRSEVNIIPMKPRDGV
jgi:hypothetical protein